MIFVVAFCVTALCVITIKSLVPTYAKPSRLLSPYDTVVKVRLGEKYSLQPDVHTKNSSPLAELLRPMVESCTRLLTSITLFESDEKLVVRLAHAGMQIQPDQFKLSSAKKILGSIGIGFLLGAGIGSVAAFIFFPVIFAVIAVSKSRSTIDKAIDRRCRTIRLELYTVDQLLALHIRTGAGVVQALQSISARTTGIVAFEFAVILSRVRSGMPIDESLYIACKETPELHARRTYKLLAATSKRGADLTQGLLDLAQDLRRSLREDIKATSAKRRAAMLIPTIGILAPIMLLFVAAPIPSIVLGGQ